MITLAKLRKRLPVLKDWLVSRGAEVLEPTNEWEVLRFRAAGETHVVYRNARGEMTISKPTMGILNRHFSGDTWSAGVATTRRRYSTDERALLKRDGDCCFLCWLPLGEDLTVEHLVAVVHGGANHIANKALAHAGCNSQMGHKPLMEKIRMRESMKPAMPAERMAA